MPSVKNGASIICLFLIMLILAGSLFTVSTASDETQTPIKHVIYIMMENHSFDNFFGVYPGNSTSLGIEIPTNLINRSGGVVQVPQLSAVPPGTFNTQNPGESVYRQDFDNGAMDGFATYSGPQAMTYFTSSQLAIEWDWAEEYGLGDNYFSSVLAQTTPNRLFSLAGYTPVMTDTGPPPYVPFNRTIFSQLSEYGVSWKVYGGYASSYPMNFFLGIDSYSGTNFGSWGSFQQDLGNGNLPEFSYVSSLGSSDVDQHPSDNVTFGEVWLSGIVNEVMQSQYWNSSVIFINYDEGGGYYDQVPPPMLDGMQLGFRVPFLVISPFSKEGYVSHTEMNHDSILGFVEYNWNIPALNSFVSDSYLPLDFFDFSQTPRAPLIFTDSSTFPAPIQIPFHQLNYSRIGSSDINLANLKDYTTKQTTSQSTSSYPLTSTNNMTSLSEVSNSGSVSYGVILGVVITIAALTVVAGIIQNKKRRAT